MTNFVHVHGGQPVFAVGKAPEQARAAAILLHGRGASARDILGLVPEIEHPDCAFIAPQASGYTWYPHRFIEPVQKNEPHLSSALRLIDENIARLKTAGIPKDRIVVIGFSQGACLALEYVARSGERFGGAAALTGGLIGEAVEPSRYPASLDGTPVFLGCSDEDFHVPRARVEESAALLKQIGAAVTLRIYPRMGHTINGDEIDFVRSMIAEVARAPEH